MPLNLRPAVRLVLHASGWNPRLGPYRLLSGSSLASPLSRLLPHLWRTLLPARSNTGHYCKYSHPLDLFRSLPGGGPTHERELLPHGDQISKDLWRGRELAFERSGSVFCCSRASTALDFAHFNLFREMMQAAAAALTISSFLAYFAQFFSALATCLATHIQMSLLGFPRGEYLDPVLEEQRWPVSSSLNRPELGQDSACEPVEATEAEGAKKMGVEWVIGADGAQGYFSPLFISWDIFNGCVAQAKELVKNTSGSTRGRNTAFLVTDVEMGGLDRQYWAAYGSAGTRLVLALAMGQFSVKGSLVMKSLSPRSLLSTYEMEHMPRIEEMLELTTNLHIQSMSDNDLASKDASQSVNPGFVRDDIFKQLGVNYQWSEVVLDQHLDSKKKVNIGNKVHMPYGNEDGRIQAGDRVADAPNLVLVPAATEPTTTTIS
ncbi:hypothetical protein BS47DRAFT_1398656 [Hydnum rufescens UP504]|uniref:Uncharacterized protein n=1 Tax=Hydnum rufescens UP504 TaxID=1448309 RepID=A0A9P6DQH3_9AGAM|nr:hypothetical protein BS47DRAFT_1398656 [Hydnum rufescens UP504]